MIEFISLFLGLVMGVHTVEVSAGAEVATVELLLDGRSIGRLEGEPWSGRFDFGRELSPAALVAVARDGEGEEIGRASQWLNVLRPRAEARLSLERAGGVATALLGWQAVDFDDPRAAAVYFDGEYLEDIADPRRFELPRHDPKQSHFLRAELYFSDLVQARAELVFGGLFVDRVTSDLTAVPVVFRRRSTPRPEALEGWFLKDGRALRVAAVERPPAKLFVVREMSERNLKGMKSLAEARRSRIGAQVPVSWGVRMNTLRYVFPTDVRREGQGRQVWQRMEVSKNMAGYGDGRILTGLAVLSFAHEVPAPTQRLADAVATAGLLAAAGDQPRAVILITSGEAEDTSHFPVDVVRGFLRRVHVPLVVWTPNKKLAKSGAGAWGEAEGITTLQTLAPAIGRLRDVLRDQAVVWLEGSHLPHQVEISDQAKGVRLAGAVE